MQTKSSSVTAEETSWSEISSPGITNWSPTSQGVASSQVTYLAVAAGDDLRFDMRLSETASGATPRVPRQLRAARCCCRSRSAFSTRERTRRDEGAHCRTGSELRRSPGARAACLGCGILRSSSLCGARPGVHPHPVAMNPHPGPGPGRGSIKSAAPAASTCCNAEDNTKSAPFSFDNTWENNTPAIKTRRWLQNISRQRSGSTPTTSKTTTSRKTTPWAARPKASGTANSNWSR